MQPDGLLPDKPCPQCGAMFSRRPQERPHAWRRRIHCARACSNKARRLPFEADRLWFRVLKMPSGCWEWQASRKTRGGYGQLNTRIGERLTHRLAWIAANGPIPAGLWVLHKCDNPPCCNPDHLFLGTRTDNVRDCMAKGRSKITHRKGEDHPRARLTAGDVRAIREDERPCAVIAAHYGITAGHVSNIKNDRAWGHI